jgi:hypothetical protein
VLREAFPVKFLDSRLLMGMLLIFDIKRASGQRFTSVTEQRTRVDWAHWVKELVDVRYGDADLIVLVMDNLNVHSIGSLYEAFAPAEAKKMSDRSFAME